jgi:hypothetical protein
MGFADRIAGRPRAFDPSERPRRTFIFRFEQGLHRYAEFFAEASDRLAGERSSKRLAPKLGGIVPGHVWLLVLRANLSLGLSLQSQGQIRHYRRRQKTACPVSSHSTITTLRPNVARDSILLTTSGNAENDDVEPTIGRIVPVAIISKRS